MKPCLTCEAGQDGVCLAVLAEQPTVTEWTADGVWVARIAIAKAGTLMPQHVHAHEHLTVVARGEVRVTAKLPGADVQQTVCAPDAITIPANVPHLFETLENDVLLLCVHNTARTGTVELLAEHQIVGRP